MCMEFEGVIGTVCWRGPPRLGAGDEPEFAEGAFVGVACALNRFRLAGSARLIVRGSGKGDIDIEVILAEWA